MHLYLIQSDVNGYIKIGRTDDIAVRLSQLQTGSPYRLKLIHKALYCGDYERDLHKMLQKHGLRLRLDGEWFDPECLRYIPDDFLIDFDWENEYWWRKK